MTQKIMSAHTTKHCINSIVPQSVVHPNIFFTTSQDYVYSASTGIADPLGNNAYLPIEIDTEFHHLPVEINRVYPKQPSPTITVQCRSIAIAEGAIFTHMDSAAYARHPLTTSEFAVVDYLRSLGHDVHLEKRQGDLDDLPWLQIDLYAYFAVAELFRVCRDDFRADVMSLCIDAESKGCGIVQGRRIRTFTRLRGEYLPWVAVPWVITINGRRYAVRIAWWDTSAVHGAGSYADFCSNTGTPIPHKDNFTPSEKADMLRMYCERQSDFDSYALGDLYNHQALINNVPLFNTIYSSLDLKDYARPPRLTTGATVRDLLEASIGKLLSRVHPNAKGRELVNVYCEYGTATEIKKRLTTTGAYNAKVDGGRCRNNRPTNTVLRGVLCDLDISGCYGEGLRVQIYPLGVPVTIDYPLKSKYNEYMSLGKFLELYQSELVPGLWQARISTPIGYRLKHPQDYLMSWVPPKDVSKIPCDTELSETDEWWSADNVGLLKVFTHELNLALINHDFIQWLDNVASRGQRKELLENTQVICALYYPASERVDSVEKLRDAHNAHNGKNTCTVKKVGGKTTVESLVQECHSWYGVTLGELGITELLVERKKHPKKSPLNELLKLCINTIYGDMVSSYFSVGNVVVGNNITARARSLAWYMEKGLHGFQTITDGCAFDVNKVLHFNKVKVNGENVVGLYRERTGNLNLEFKPLAHLFISSLQCYEDGKIGLNLSRMCEFEYGTCLDAHSKCEIVSDKCITVLNPTESLEWVNRTTMIHLQGLFPNVDVLHQLTTDVYGVPRKGQFSFEGKGFYEAGVFHGTSNYLFQNHGEVTTVKMRSYTKKSVERLVDESLTIADGEYYPATEFLTGLIKNPAKLKRPSIFLRPRILKVGDFSRHYVRRYEGSTVYPGMTVKEASLLREFSLSQFTYQSLVQYLSWERESENLRKHYGQSYEMYFLNKDGTLNYQLMVETIDQKIADNKHGYWDGMNKRSKHGYREQTVHPHLGLLGAWREGLADFYHYRSKEVFDDVESENVLAENE